MDFITRDEMNIEIQRAGLIGDDKSIMITDTPDGQMVEEIIDSSGAGGLGTAVFEPYFFIATRLSGTTVEIAEGPYVHGEDVETVPTSLPITITETGYISLRVTYGTSWEFNWEASPDARLQDKESGRWAERFSIAYVEFAGGEITKLDQINIKELRSSRLA